MRSAEDVDALLDRWGRGDRTAEARLVDVLYAELRVLARRAIRGERAAHTLQPTDLVHEAYLRLVGLERIDWQGRTHFLALAGRVMREVLVDHARRRRAAKRGGGAERVTLAEGMLAATGGPVDLLDLDAALSELTELDPQRARLVELRAFGGLTVSEAAAVLDVSERTVKRLWRGGVAWLAVRLGEPA